MSEKLMPIDEAVARVKALRGRLRSQGTQSTKPWKKALRHGDAQALTVLLALTFEHFTSPTAGGSGSYPNDGRDGAKIIADAGMNQMGT